MWYLCIFIYIVFTCVDVYALIHKKQRFFKMLLMPTLMLILYMRKPWNTVLLLALGFCWVGDIFLIQKTKKRMLGGTIAFWIGHILYSVYFFLDFHITFFAFIGLLIYVSACCWYWKTTYPIIPKQAVLLSFLYMMTITTMSYFAYIKMLETNMYLQWIGTISFLISDTLLSKQLFKKRKQKGVMITYSFAQLCIILGEIYGI